MASNQDTLVTVFGGSGFLGRNVVRALAKRDSASGSRCGGRNSRDTCSRSAGSADPCRAGQSALSGLGRGRDARFPCRHQPRRHSGRRRRPDFDAVQATGAETSPRPPPPPARGWCMFPRSAPTTIRCRATPAPRRPAKRPCSRPYPRPRSCGPRWCSGPKINSPTASRRWRGYRRCCR